MNEGKIRHAVGVDFGGTFIKMALVNEKGEVRSRTKFSTKEAVGLDGWMDVVAKGLKQLRGKKGDGEGELVGIGVGAPGFVDYERGFIHDLANIPGWTCVHLAPLIPEGQRAGKSLQPRWPLIIPVAPPRFKA